MKLLNTLLCILIIGLWVIPAPVQAADPLGFLFPMLKPPAPDYVIDGDKVVYEDENVYMDASPHTLSASGWVTFRYKTKKVGGSMDVVFGFNDNLQISKPQFLNPEAVRTKYNEVKSVKTATFEPVSIVKSTVLSKADRVAKLGKVKTGEIVKEDKADIGDETLNANYAEVECDVVLPPQINEGLVREIINIAYDSFDGKKYTYKYNAVDQVPYTVIEEGLDNIKAPISNTVWSNQGMNKWQSVYSGKTAAVNQLNETKVWIDIPFAGIGKVEGKYVVGLKPSSLTVNQAKADGQLWLIDPWYNSSWGYRKAIVITHSTNDTLPVQTNYQMMLIVHYGGLDADDVPATGVIHTPNASVGDFDDLRFTNSSNTTELHYWIESYTASTDATVWVEVDSIAAHPTDTTIYMYYGNAGAAAASDGTAVFPLFDHFEAATLDATKWDTIGTCTVTTQQDGGSAVKIEVNDLVNNAGIQSKTNLSTTAIRGNILFGSGRYSDFGLWGTGQYAVWDKNTPSGDRAQSSSGGSESTAYDFNENIYNIFDILHVDSVGQYYYCADTLRATHTTKILTIDDLRLALTGFNEFTFPASTVYANWLLVRNYTANAPTWGSFGAEEAFPAGPPTTITLPASVIGTTTATLNAETTDGLAVTKRGFAWGLTSNITSPGQYGVPPASYTTNWTEGNAGFPLETFDYNAAGLTADSVYYYRGYSYNATGYGWGDEVQFITSPTQVTTKACTGFGSTWAVVNGELLALPSITTSVGFDYGLTSAYGLSATSAGTYSSGLFSSYLSGLSPATVYHYRAKAYISGTWYYGLDKLFATKGSPVPYEAYNGVGGGNSPMINSGNITYQTFTTNDTIPHSITTVKLKMRQVGTLPVGSTVTAGIRATSNSTLGQTCLTYPTGVDLASGSLDGSTFAAAYTWQTFTMVLETCLSANTTYAIVVSCPTATTTNHVLWEQNAANVYIGGNAGYSADSGTTWINLCPADQLFEIWGNPCIEVSDAKVFMTYIETGDWLITVLYKNLYPPYYAEAKDVSALFVLQLCEVNPPYTVIAQTKCFEWGYKPGAIYLSRASVIPLEWGHAYRVRLYGVFTGNPYAEYVLQPADWMGSDLTRLDNWVRMTASLMEKYYNTSLTIYLADRGIVLNSAGGVIFATDIPQLSVVRPNLFSIVTSTHPYVPGTYTQSYQDTLVWTTMWGPQLTLALDSVGVTLGLGTAAGATVGSWIGFMVYALVALFCFRPGHAIAAMVIPVPILLIAFGTGLAELALMGILLAVATIIFVWQVWFKGG